MPIDPKSIKWDAPDPAAVKWDDAPDEVKALAESRKQTTANQVGGVVRGLGGLVTTVMTPYDMLAGNTKSIGNPERRKAMDEGLTSLIGSDPSSGWYQGMKTAAEVVPTLGIGGAAANLLSRVPGLAAAAPNAIQAVRTAGMSAGNATGKTAMALRTAGGAITGGLSAGAVNPEDAGVGAGIGAITPGLLQLAGWAGKSVYNAVKGGQPNAGKLLAQALGVSDAELPGIIAAANNAPAEIVPGSKLTFSQALQTQGKNTPGAKMLERVVAGGPGGDPLLKRFANQGEARMAALQAQGAETYQGAAGDLATRYGDKIGAIVRTQKGDEAAARKAAWQAIYGQAERDGVALRFPLDLMDDAMRPLGRGTVGAGGDARSLVAEANKIGTYEVPPITFGKSAAGGKQESLLDAVKRAGGINQNTVSSKLLGGEVSTLREGGLGRVVFKNKGQSVAKMAEKMHEAGFIPDEDPATLIDLLRNAGKSTFSRGADMESTYRAMAERAMGDAPDAAQRFEQAVPFEEFQRLWRSAGDLGRKVGSREGGVTEAAVIGKVRNLLAGRVDDAASGNLLAGESISPDFAQKYMAERAATAGYHDKWSGGNNIASILRKPVGQDFSLTGDEVMRKLWHGGGGLAGDVSNLKRVLSSDNAEPSMNALQKYIMTDAASKTTAAGEFGSALPKYVEGRLNGLQEALKPEQFNALSSVASDIRNAEAAAAIPGLRGSDTQAKIARALDAGLMDSPIAKTIARLTSFKGIGLEMARAKIADALIANKGKTLAALLADPKAAAIALQDSAVIRAAGPEAAHQLRLAAARAAPALAAD